jgi:hypothetical protein
MDDYPLEADSFLEVFLLLEVADAFDSGFDDTRLGF